MATDPLAEIRASFFVECEELLETLQDGLTALERGQADDETVHVCFRAVHSIKGGAGAFGLEDLVRYSHSFESALDALRSGVLVPGPADFAVLFRAVDLLADVIGVARDGGQVEPGRMKQSTTDLVQLLNAGADPAPAPVQAVQATGRWRIVFTPLPALYQSGNEPLHLLRAIGAMGTAQIYPDLRHIPVLEDLDPESAVLGWTIDVLSDAPYSGILELFDFVEGLCSLSVEPLADEKPAPNHKMPTTSRRPKAPDKGTEPLSEPSNLTAAPIKPTVRVDLDRIDRLVNLVGELVINQAMLSQSVDAAGLQTNTAVSQGLEEFMQLTRDIQDSVMMIRAQPVKSLFQRMSRIVRESAANLGKSVRLDVEGDATEVDKTVIERLADPLTHMIRNSIDHGLEPAEDRRAAGKAETGVITLAAAHRSGRVVIEIRDDGRGIDRARVRDIAIRRGLIPEDATLGASEIDSLIFLPGFSTASEVTDLSGRGVGMDVVRSAIQDLGGRVTIDSETGSGTTISISLPLTLAVLDGMVLRSAGETLVMPIASIQETLSLEDMEIRRLGPETSVLHVRDSFIPLLDLANELGYRGPLDTYDGHVVLMIAQESGARAALIVDSIEEQRQVVIKGLEDSYGRAHGIAAATILGDGQVALILDPIDLMANARGQTRRALPEALAG